VRDSSDGTKIAGKSLKVLIILVISCAWRFQYNSPAFVPGSGISSTAITVTVNAMLSD
jgi:hypothetical protein